MTIQTMTYKQFTRNVTAVSKAGDKLAQLANAAAYQACTNGNLDWINRLFQGVNSLTLKSGELSKQGKELKAYIAYHAPSLKVEKAKSGKNEGLIVAKLGGTKAKRGLFFTGEYNDDDSPIMVDPAEHPQFAMTMDEWREQAGTKKESKPRTVDSMAKSVDKLAETLASGEFDGDHAALKALVESADAMAKAAQSQAAAIEQRAGEAGKQAAAERDAADVDADAALQAQTGAHSGKAKASERAAG